jgi:DNA N-6-adenine-methyltransferase Dam
MSGPNSDPEIGQQNYRTPVTFLAACLRRFELERIDWDCACTEQDSVGESGGYFFPQVDALAQDWRELADPTITAFFNPPFAQSGAFCGKAAASGARVLALIPVAIGTQWWRQHVHRKAVVVGVGRLVFNNPDGTPVLGKNGKPQGINRDCALLAYNILPTGTDWYLLENWRDW